MLLCQPRSAAPTHFWFLNELLPCVIYNDVLLWSYSGHPTAHFHHQLKGLRPRSVLVAQGQRKRELGQLYLVRTIVANVTFNTKWQLNARFGFLTAISVWIINSYLRDSLALNILN